MAKNVFLKDNSGSDNQRWKIINKNGYFILKNKATNEVLDLCNANTSNNTNIQTYTENGTDAQLFNLKLVNHDLAYYHIITPKSDPNKLLTAVGNGVHPDTNINIYENIHNMTQKFYLRKEKDNHYIIIHSFSGKALTA